MKYDPEHEAKVCANELFYRNGPVAAILMFHDVNYVAQTIERYLREAVASRDAEIQKLEADIESAESELRELRDQSW